MHADSNILPKHWRDGILGLLSNQKLEQVRRPQELMEKVNELNILDVAS